MSRCDGGTRRNKSCRKGRVQATRRRYYGGDQRGGDGVVQAEEECRVASPNRDVLEARKLATVTLRVTTFPLRAFFTCKKLEILTKLSNQCIKYTLLSINQFNMNDLSCCNYSFCLKCVHVEGNVVKQLF